MDKNSRKYAYTHTLQKLFVNSKAFGVRRLRIYQFEKGKV
jgi:hypothetical protein